jgi:hypothetical protein
MLTKEDISTAKEIVKVLHESKNDELVVVGKLITVLLAEREQQRTWVGLTDEERHQVMQDRTWMHTEGLCQAIEAKLKQKNFLGEEQS